MRIATWNVESLRRLSPERGAALQGAMAGVDADVWVLTETWATFAPGPDFRLVARSGGAVDLSAWPDRCWVSVWAKPPLVAGPLDVRRHPDRVAAVATRDFYKRVVEFAHENRVVVQDAAHILLTYRGEPLKALVTSAVALNA